MCIRDRSDGPVAFVVTAGHHKDPTFNANKCLIESAPDLLEALEDLCDFKTECTQDKWDNARAVIAKARGDAF